MSYLEIGTLVGEQRPSGGKEFPPQTPNASNMQPERISVIAKIEILNIFFSLL